MCTVKQLLKKKGAMVWSVAPDDSVFDALRLMSEKNVGAVLVVQDGKLAGIFSERDYARKVILKGKFSKEMPVREIMTSRVLSVSSHQTTAVCMALMTRHHIRHLPVVDDEQLVGLISMRDVVESIISEQEDTIERLESYVQGPEPGI
jgi:CBS domain-containing protein